MTEAYFEEYPLTALDGFPCSLWRFKKDGPSPDGPVLLVHGAGLSGNIFNPPGPVNLPHLLSRVGYDVWVENWRGSAACQPNQWNLDQVALNDHPAAVREICRITGSTEVKVISHDQGSTTFMISALKGLVPQARVIVSNGVSLHPQVPRTSLTRMTGVLTMMSSLTNYLDPGWGDHPSALVSRSLKAWVNLTHWERDSQVGKFASFTYGGGHPALWQLPNMLPEVREWARTEFGKVPMSYLKHMHKCVSAGELVSADASEHYTDGEPKTDARFVFLAGMQNKCFLHQGQERTFAYFNEKRPGYHRLYEYEGYSHLDIFLGARANRDVFPDILRELQR